MTIKVRKVQGREFIAEATSNFGETRPAAKAETREAAMNSCISELKRLGFFGPVRFKDVVTNELITITI